MDKVSNFRLVIIRNSELPLFFHYDTKAELVVAEMMIQKGLSGIISAIPQQWVDENHSRHNGEDQYMTIYLH